MVVGKDPGDSRREYRLPVGAESMAKEQRVLVRHASEAIADHTLEVLLQELVASRHLIEKALPRRTPAGGSSAVICVK